MTTGAIRRFIVWLQQSVRAHEHNPRRRIQDKGISPQTVQGYVRALKAFFSWAERVGYLEQNPARRLRAHKVPYRVVQTLSQYQIRRFLAPSI